jgi:hypothetical protein
MKSNIITEEQKSTGALFAYIDLLFLVICFFLLLLTNAGKQSEEQKSEVSIVKEQLKELQKKYILATQRLQILEPLAAKAQAIEKNELHERQIAKARKVRKGRKKVARILYQVLVGEKVQHQGKVISVYYFLNHIINPLRKNSWIALRSSASSSIPFGDVVKIRKILLKDQGEFDTFWSSVGSQQK